MENYFGQRYETPKIMLETLHKKSHFENKMAFY